MFFIAFAVEHQLVEMLVRWASLVVVVCCLGLVEGERPKLVSSSVWYTEPSVLNVDFDLAVVRMEFDQPLYTNGASFLCGSATQSCGNLTCVPCDWSGQEVFFFFFSSFFLFSALLNYSFSFTPSSFSQLDVVGQNVVDQHN